MKPFPFIPKLVLCYLCILVVNFSFSQVNPITKIEKVTEKDFKPVSPVIDENANAVVLLDIGSSDFEGNNDGDITMIFKISQRILIRNRNAFDAATIKIPIYLGESYEDEESFKDFEATTYNLENGVIKETKLDKASLFKEKYNKIYSQYKFTFPNLKEGSIIEYKYTIKSRFWSMMRGWRFQSKYPVLWSQYQVILPPMFDYYSTRKGYLPYAIDSVRKEFKSYSIRFPSGGVNFYDGDAIVGIWAMKDVPAFKKEAYTSSNENYFSEINFHLHKVRYSETNSQVYLKSWSEKAKDLLKEPLYIDITESNRWLNDDLAKVVDSSNDEETITRKLYYYIRDNFANNGDKTIRPSQTIKKTFQGKSGNVADINLLFIAMLKNRGINADPVILSTRENGMATEMAPLMNEYNYLMTKVEIEKKRVLLDPSQNMLGFGKIPEECLNGTGRIVKEKFPILVPMSADSTSETKSTSVFIFNDSLKGLSGNITTNLGYYESLSLRKKLIADGKEGYISSIKKSFPSEEEISNVTIDSIKQYDEPITIQYDIKFKLDDEGTIYFSPMLNESSKKNPFVSAQRLYPVEMPYKRDELFILNMEIPKGYKVDELPKSARAKLNENDGLFEYLVQSDNENIQLRCKLSFKKANFEPEDYATLRDFFTLVIKKEAEQIVLKKIK